MSEDQDRNLIRRLLAANAEDFISDMSVERKVLRGGLEASAVTLVSARYRDRMGRRRLLRFVAKRLQGRAIREAAAYRQLAAGHGAEISARLLAAEYPSPNRATLYLEAVRRVRAWPWRESRLVSELLARLAGFHAAAHDADAAVPAWNYEAELLDSGYATLEALERCRTNPDLSPLRRDLAPLRRMVLALPRHRRQLLSEGPFRAGPIHGDVHPGNALVRRRGGREVPLLVDWGRARIGSPLEDVSSWLQSLGQWEPAAERCHDRLLADYLSARGFERRLSSQLRATYWLSAASNALPGALLHYLKLAQQSDLAVSRRAQAASAAERWLRVVRRADAWCS